MQKKYDLTMDELTKIVGDVVSAREGLTGHWHARLNFDMELTRHDDSRLTAEVCKAEVVLEQLDVAGHVVSSEGALS